MRQRIESPAAWQEFWREFLPNPSPCLIGLVGPLGAGKTAAVVELARYLGVSDPVTSPTFELIHVHHGTEATLIHGDLYRLVRPQELIELGYGSEEWNEAVVCLEWANRFDFVRGDADLWIEIEMGEEPSARYVTVSISSPRV